MGDPEAEIFLLYESIDLRHSEWHMNQYTVVSSFSPIEKGNDNAEK